MNLPNRKLLKLGEAASYLSTSFDAKCDAETVWSYRGFLILRPKPSLTSREVFIYEPNFLVLTLCAVANDAEWRPENRVRIGKYALTTCSVDIAGSVDEAHH